MTGIIQIKEMITTDALQEMIQRISETHTQKNSNDYSVNDSECPICHGTGWEMIPDGGQGTCVECKCGIRQRKIMNSRLSFANIPESLKDVRISNFNETVYKDASSQNKIHTAVKAINYWLDNFETMQGRGMGLYLYSETKGSGKTRMAAGIANKLIYEKKIQVKFATSLQILNEIKASWDKHDRKYSEGKLLDFLCTSKILIIDDFGTEQAKDWIGERFYQIINSRYVDKKITIFTSNYRLDLLKYDDRIINRAKERTFQIPFPEESVRDIIASQNMNELIAGIKNQGTLGRTNAREV